MTKHYVLNEQHRRWSSHSGNWKFLFKIDPQLQSRLPKCLPQHLETLYHQLWLNVAHVNNPLFHIGQTTNPCDNCDSMESLEAILLECPAYRDELRWYKMNMEKLDQGPLTLTSMLSPWPYPSKQRKALKFLCIESNWFVVWTMTHTSSQSRLWFYFILHLPSTLIASDTYCW